MRTTRNFRWTRPLLGVGFGLALTLTLCTDGGSTLPRAPDAPRGGTSEGLRPESLEVRDRWAIRHASWDQSIDESDRWATRGEPVPRPYGGLDVGVSSQ